MLHNVLVCYHINETQQHGCSVSDRLLAAAALQCSLDNRLSAGSISTVADRLKVAERKCPFSFITK
jgi:hypothetical protein